MYLTLTLIAWVAKGVLDDVSHLPARKKAYLLRHLEKKVRSCGSLSNPLK